MPEISVGEVVRLIDEIAPFDAAEDWDNVGLLIGDRSATVERIYVCLDPTLGAIEAARGAGADIVVAHHPIMLQPLDSLVIGHAVADRVTRAIRTDLAVVAAHTNVDAVARLAVEPVAAALGIGSPAPLFASSGTRRVKVVVFVPDAAADAVAAAMAEAGAGAMGNYAECSFRASGTGTFRPLEGATPAVGQVGDFEEVAETRVEMMVETGRLRGVVAGMVEAHPYEEVAYDVYALEGASGGGFGCVGNLGEGMTLPALADKLTETFGGRPQVLPALGASAPNPDDSSTVERVAFMPGSAGGVGRSALDHGADVLVCGEMKYHEALDAREQGLTVVTVGHAASERPLVRALGEELRRVIEDRGWPVAVLIEEANGGT